MEKRDPAKVTHATAMLICLHFTPRIAITYVQQINKPVARWHKEDVSLQLHQSSKVSKLALSVTLSLKLTFSVMQSPSQKHNVGNNFLNNRMTRLYLYSLYKVHTNHFFNHKLRVQDPIAVLFQPLRPWFGEVVMHY